MAVVPAGEFTMGSSKASIDSGAAAGNESPQQKVAIKQPLAVGRLEVTRDEFDAFVKATGHKVGDKCWTLEGNEPREREGRSFRNPGYAQDGRHPAVCVSWEDANAYVDWLSKLTGKPYQLLSEAQWEYAAQAGTAGRFPSSDSETDLCALGNGADQSASAAKLPAAWEYLRCSDGHVNTAPAGSFKANAFGLHDLMGNVWEWTADCYAESLADTPADGQPRKSGDCALHAVRGGSWSATARMLRTAVRGKAQAASRFDDVGFRVARALAAGP
jgi:formylglycine-generating enzyme required for sulfatase activity